MNIGLFPPRKCKGLPQNFLNLTTDFNLRGFVEMCYHKGFTVSETKFLMNKVSQACRGKCCIDNFRFMVNSAGAKKYEKAISNGCCGFYDEVVKLNSGVVIKFGFNYGH
jgi:hypothetical protein